MSATCSECGAPMPPYAEWPRLCTSCLEAAPVTDAQVDAAARALRETHARWQALQAGGYPVALLRCADGAVVPCVWREVA
jgi:hypothetical protein